MQFKQPTATRAPLQRWTHALLVAITLFTSSAGALGLPVTTVRAQETTPDAPSAPFRRYLPTISTDNLPTETREVSVIKLNQSATQADTKTAPTDEAQSADNGALPAPPPGEEVYPAQPDADAQGITTVAPASAPDNMNATINLLYEDFDGTFPTGNWMVLDRDGTQNGEYYWDEDNFKPYNGANSAWVANGGKNGLDPEFYNYPNNLQSWMIYGPFDLADASSASLAFQYWNVSEINYDYLGWYASPNGNDFYGMRVSGNSLGWKPVTLDLASVPVVGNLLGDSSVWIAFRFTSDGNTTDRGAFIDQVRVQKEVNGNCAGEFKAEYFNNKELSGTPVFTRCEKAPINHNWGTASPGNGVNSDHFSVRWTGTFDFANENTNFVAVTDDGVRVWLDNTQIIDNWQNQGLTPNLATRRMSAGKHTLRIEYYDDVGGAAAQFRWLRSDTVVSNRHAFDTCFLPHPSEMANWWGNSPYYEIGIYIGGSNRGCKAHNEQHLTASWVDTVQKQGWNFIPTWVGPQAPCTVHNFYTMSSDPGKAFDEGRTEAGNAAEAARKLGLTTDGNGGTVIYYDMEPYPNEAGCRDAVKSFMAGWASRLHELGNQAGAYGAACASYMSDWVMTPPYTIDQIWPAAWIYPGYNDNASVWDVSCIDNSIFTNQQRIRQYAGDHNERWGNLTLNIDSNIVGGQVAGTIPRTSSTAAPQEAWQSVQVAGMQLLTEQSGWVIADGGLLWTSDGGATWEPRTPNALPLQVRAATFLDVNTGWLVGAGLPNGEGRSPLYLGKTSDGGRTWQLDAVDEFNPIEPSSTQGKVTLTFVDANTGYLQIKLASSSNFELYTTLKSADGGTTWQEIDAMPDTVTAANSASTQIVTAAASLGATATTASVNHTAWAFVENGVCSGAKPDRNALATAEADAAPFDCIQHRALLATPDGGNTWLDITPVVE